MIKREITDEAELKKLDEAIALKNVSNMPARVKCALLAWHTLEDLLNEKKSPWIDPFSKEEHNESLINIYYDSEHLYQEIVNIFYQYIHNNKKMVDILNKIENKSYITNQDFSTQYNINL